MNSHFKLTETKLHSKLNKNKKLTLSISNNPDKQKVCVKMCSSVFSVEDVFTYLHYSL